MLENLIHLVTNNPVLAGVAGGGLITGAIGFALYQLRALPGRILGLIKSQFTVTLTIHNDSSAFQNFSLWLSRQPATQKSRRLTVAQWWSRTMDRTEFALTPGAGRHFIRHKGQWVMVERSEGSPSQPSAGAQPSGAPAARQETIVFTTLGRSQAPIKKLLAEIAFVEEDGDALPIYMHGSGQIGRRQKRSTDTVYLEEAMKRDILQDVDRFVGRRQWYADRAIPWRRGYMLSGPPGTGKSSLIFAIASRLNRPVLIVNPSTISNDRELQYALNAHAGAVVALEDVDSIEILKARPNLALVREQAERASGGQLETASDIPSRTGAVSVKAGEGLTLSGFLNAIDGVAAQEGRIMFFTSNTPEVLDAALLRPGRIDRSYVLGPAQMPQALKMFANFFPGADPAVFSRSVAAHLPMPAAELQDMLLAMALEDGGDPVGALRQVLNERLAS